MRSEGVLDDPDVAYVIATIEDMLPVGVRPRQLRVRTLLVGMLIAQADSRPAHLTRVHEALVALGEPDRWRLGVLATTKAGPHLLTYRQVERTFSLVVAVLDRGPGHRRPSGLTEQLSCVLLEASIAGEWKDASRSLGLDWTDLESFSRPPVKRGGECFDMEASWGHRRSNRPGDKGELFFGYYVQFATMVADEGGGKVPELARRMLVTSCHIDAPPAFVAVLQAMVAQGIALGDVLVDSGYSHRVASNFAAPLRILGAELVMDLHPSDRGPQGTHLGAVIANGSLYCPCTPQPLLSLGPTRRDASTTEAQDADRRSAELDRYRLGRVTKDDSDGYHRVMCPAQLGKVRCPLREASMELVMDRPEVLHPPEHPPACCVQKTITVSARVASKTAQKHPYPSKAWRRSYDRRAAAERTNATIKDPATNDVKRGWCRLAGVTAISVFLACTLVVRNMRVTDSFETRRLQDERRARAGLGPKTRRRRRKTLSDLVDSGNARLTT